jgi:hypothetical protein
MQQKDSENKPANVKMYVYVKKKLTIHMETQTRISQRTQSNVKYWYFSTNIKNILRCKIILMKYTKNDLTFPMLK